MKIYFAPNTISIAAVIALEEAQLLYDPVKLDFASAEQTASEYLQINPKGRVPALVTGNDVITETGAILEYIHGSAPQAKLVPDNPLLAARMREVMYYLASTMHVNHAHKLRGARWANNPESWKDFRTKVPETMAASCAYIESHLLRGPYILGDEFSLADIYLYVITTWLKGDKVDISAFPKLMGFIKKMQSRASVKTVTDAGML